MSNLMKIRAVGTGLFHVDGHTYIHTYRQTDMKKLIVAFRNFANAAKNQIYKMTYVN